MSKRLAAGSVAADLSRSAPGTQCVVLWLVGGVRPVWLPQPTRSTRSACVTTTANVAHALDYGEPTFRVLVWRAVGASWSPIRVLEVNDPSVLELTGRAADTVPSNGPALEQQWAVCVLEAWPARTRSLPFGSLTPVEPENRLGGAGHWHALGKALLAQRSLEEEPHTLPADEPAPGLSENGACPDRGSWRRSASVWQAPATYVSGQRHIMRLPVERLVVLAAGVDPKNDFHLHGGWRL